MLVPAICMLLVSGSMLIPVYTQRALLWRRNILFGIIGVMLLSVPAIFWWSVRSMQRKLKDGIWYDTVHQLALLAGVRVRNVVLVRSPMVNAYASAFGTVALTTGLIEKLEPDEARAAIAHELGHLKCGHPRTSLAVRMVTYGLFLAAWILVERRLAPHLSVRESIMLNNPFVYLILSGVVVMLIIGPGSRRRELQADRFAVLWTGDPDLVIRALTRIHDLNASPRRLKPSDESLSTHPSLAHRIEAIRRL